MLPDGQRGLAIVCDGKGGHMGICMNSAAKACGGKYEIISKDEIGRAMVVRCQ